MYQHAYVPREKNSPGQQFSLGHFGRVAPEVPQRKLLTQSLIWHCKSQVVFVMRRAYIPLSLPILGTGETPKAFLGNYFPVKLVA